jgi:hypothetical protein
VTVSARPPGPSGPNSFIGQVRVEDGALRVKHASALGSASGNTVVLDAAGPDGALEIEGSFTIGESILLDGSAHALLRQVSGNTTITPDVRFNPSTDLVVLGQLTFTATSSTAAFMLAPGSILMDRCRLSRYRGGTVILNGTVAGRLTLRPTQSSVAASAALIVSTADCGAGPGLTRSARHLQRGFRLLSRHHGTTAGSYHSLSPVACPRLVARRH